jgi:uncharacterized damage-inducible protein DinB
MITDIASYLRFFDSVRRRTERDVAALPAAAWRPPAVGGEGGWGIGQIVAHIGASRLYFASAYRGEGWVWEEAGANPGDQRTWLPWLERSAERFGALLRETPAAWLARRVEMIASQGARNHRDRLASPFRWTSSECTEGVPVQRRTGGELWPTRNSPGRRPGRSR